MVEEFVRTSLDDGTALDALELHFQPVVRLDTREVYGAESFVKWRHPERGILPTAAWIPHATRTGAIAECTRRVLPSWAATSQGAGGPIISLNFSGQQLIDPSFMSDVLAIDPAVAGGLAIEIHQLQFAVDHANVVSPEVPWLPVDDLDEQMDELRAHGFAVWLDDFGDGGEEEAMLGHASIDLVKLDQRLLDAPPAALERLVETIHRHGKLALFECIETGAHEQLATAAGADLGQGFLYAPTLDAAGFADLVAVHQA